MRERYYCPACGQVAGDSTTRHIARVKARRVEPHALASAQTAFRGGEEVERCRRKCPGGPIDKVRDRAP